MISFQSKGLARRLECIVANGEISSELDSPELSQLPNFSIAGDTTEAANLPQ